MASSFFKSAVLVDGIRPTVANIGRVRRNIREANKAFVLRKSAQLFQATTGMVPYASGTLYGAAYIREISARPGFPIQEVGYDTGKAPYAALVHETTGLDHPTRGPRHEAKSDHFLSTPRDAMAGTFASELKEELVGVIRGMRSLSSGQRSVVIGQVGKAFA